MIKIMSDCEIGLHMGKNKVQHGHFKSCRTPTWPFIKTVESNSKPEGLIKSDMAI